LDGGSVEYINTVNAIIPSTCLIISVILVHINVTYPKFDKADIFYEKTSYLKDQEQDDTKKQVTPGKNANSTN